MIKCAVQNVQRVGQSPTIALVINVRESFDIRTSLLMAFLWAKTAPLKSYVNLTIVNYRRLSCDGLTNVLRCTFEVRQSEDFENVQISTTWEFLVHLSRRLKCTIVITRCPSSVRPSVVNFPHFRLLLWNRWREFNQTSQEARYQRPLPSLCFSGRSDKQDGRPGLWLAETFLTSPLKPLKGIQRNLIGSKISTSSTRFVFFGSIGKTRWPPWPLIGWDIFNFSSETAEGNSTKLDRKQDLNILYQVCVFQADRKNKMAALASDWLRHFSTSPLKPLNRIQRNLTGSKISTSSTLFVFFGPNRKNKMAAMADSSKRLHIVLRCTICGPLGLLFISRTTGSVVGNTHDNRDVTIIINLVFIGSLH